jgi:cell division protein FtsA
MAKHNTTVGIDIGSSFIRVVVAGGEGSSGKLPMVLGTGIVPSAGLRHGYVVSRDEAARALRDALRNAEKESGIRIRHAALCVGGIGIGSESAIGSAIVSRADSIVSRFDIDKAIADAETQIELKNKAILHAFPTSFKVDGKELPARPEGITGGKLEVKTLFITVLEQHLDDLIGVVNDAGVKVTSFTAMPIAAEKLILTDLQRNFGCALIDIGAETVSVAVFENNNLASTHVFGIGSLDITKDIALGLRVTPEEAESLKMGAVSFQSIPKKKLDEIIDARLSDIFELVDKYFKKIGRSGLLPAGAILIGGGSNLSMIESVAKSMLKIPVKTGRLELQSTKGPLKDRGIACAYGVAIGDPAHLPSSKATTSHGDGDGFLSVIKTFFKQLMP